jgi:hypothetical protein
MSEKKEKKPKVIHTRVSATMDHELKERAAGLGVSVSNLVRNVLQNTFGLVEDIVTDSASVARSARGESKAEDEEADPTIVGWQVLVLNVNAICTSCNAILAKGSEAALAMTQAGPATREFRCLTCLKELTDDADPQPGE